MPLEVHQHSAFVVLLGTRMIHGLTMPPLLIWLNLPADHIVETKIVLAPGTALKAAMKFPKGEDSKAPKRLSLGYQKGLGRTRTTRWTTCCGNRRWTLPAGP